MSDDDAMLSRAEQVEKAGKEKFGAGWTDRVNALGTVGMPADIVRAAIERPDAVDVIDVAGRQALLNVMSNASDPTTRRTAEEAYGKIRDTDHAAHRKL